MNIMAIAGPNGAGKTTLSMQYLPRMGLVIPFVNGDIIAAELSPEAPEAAAQRAGRIALARMESYAAEGRDFTLETTLSGRGYLRRLLAWRQRGYRIGIVYPRLPSADQVVKRVAQRVREGGHDIPEPVARRRFERSWRNFVDVYRPVADAWQVYDTSGRSPTLVATSNGTDILPLPPLEWRMRELPVQADAAAREAWHRQDDDTRREGMAKEAEQAPDRFPEGEPSVKNVMIALRLAQKDALARAEAVRRREAEAARAEETVSAAEN